MPLTLPIARVAVDTGLAHLDRPFDYVVPEGMDTQAQPGCRVRVRFAGRLVDGVLLERVPSSSHQGVLAPLASVVSGEAVLTTEVMGLCREVADRWAGSFWDVTRLALPARHHRVECEEVERVPIVAVPAPQPGSWIRYTRGPAFLDALAAGHSPRAVWSALPGPTWPAELAVAVRAVAASGRGVLVVVPDGHDLTRVSVALGDLDHVRLRADLGPAKRYRAFLRVLRGQCRVVVGTRAAAYAPVADLGLVVVWDDGDDSHAEPRAPYPHVRDVLVLRAHRARAGALLGGLARTAEVQLLLDTGWAGELGAAREQVRAFAPRVRGTQATDEARDPVARSARIPGLAFEAARQSLTAGFPVLVQVPRRGYVPALACARDSTPARCRACSGPLAATSGHAIAACRWCGQLAGGWRCPSCDGSRFRASVVGARRTAEELGRAFPGIAVRTSGGDQVLVEVPGRPALVVATPGAEPVAESGYGTVVLLDAWVALGRTDLRAGEEALRRWFGAAALARSGADGGRVVVVADQASWAVQALVRWDPVAAAERELADRQALGFPPWTRVAAVEGSANALAEVAEALVGQELLGPVQDGDGERLLVRVARNAGRDLAVLLREVQVARSARKAEPVRICLDPVDLG